MKSKISFFNSTVFLKDLTRFAPAWAIYFTCSLLVFWGVFFPSNETFSINVMPLCVAVAAVAGFAYALLSAELLFGDLFTSRLCHAIHAMPMRREGWFLTHTLAGLCFGFLPNLVLALCMIPRMPDHWQTAFWWMAAADLQYLFFFSAAVLCMFLTGNRFAAAIVYGLVNFFSLLIRWFITTLYLPLLPGVQIQENGFTKWCPLVRMLIDDSIPWDYSELPPQTTKLPLNWSYLLILGGLAIGLLAVAMLLYRRRKLECAGDFLAVKILQPVFLVLYTLTVGGVFHLFGSIFNSRESNMGFLSVGILLGYFTGQMLLQRQIRVFGWKSAAGFAALTLVLFGSISLAKYDVFGIAHWLPEAKEVKSVQVGFSSGQNIRIDDPQAVETILESHQAIIDCPQTVYRGANIEYTYRMDDGRSVRRVYKGVSHESKTGTLLRPYLSSPEMVFGYKDREKFRESVTYIDFHQEKENQLTELTEPGDMEKFLDALEQDCAAGNMVQQSNYHETSDYAAWISVGCKKENGSVSYINLTVWTDAVHTMEFMEQQKK